MKKLMMILAVLMAAFVLQADVLVQWGQTGVGNQGATDIVTANVNYVGRSSTFTAGSADNPVVGANYYPNATGRNAIFAQASSTSFKQALVAEAASGDRLTSYDTIASGLTFRNMVMWDAANFLSTPIGKTFNSVTMDIGARDVTNTNAGARVIVQQGSSFYVTASQSFIGGTPQTLAFNLATATWYDFTPFASGVEVIGSAATVSLADIEGIGYYATVQNGDAANKATGSQLSYFQAAAVVPEPGTLSLMGVFALVLFGMRRFLKK